MEHPELIWRMSQSILEDRRRNPVSDDTGIAWATRKVLGHAFIAIGTRLTPAPTDAGRQPLELPMAAAPLASSK